MPERAPFNASFVPDPEKLMKLKVLRTKIAVLPVVTSLAEEKINSQSLSVSVKEQRIADLRELADYFRNRIISAFTEYDGDGLSSEGIPVEVRKFTIVDEPTDDSFVWEIAITEISPNAPEVSILATVAGFLIPGGGTLRIFGTGSIAMEGIVRDGATGELLAEFRDRESDKSAPISVRDYQMYAHIRRTIDDWADQFAELAGTPNHHKVEDSLPFTLDPT